MEFTFEYRVVLLGCNPMHTLLNLYPVELCWVSIIPEL